MEIAQRASRYITIAALVATAAVIGAPGGASARGAAVDPADFQPAITNPLFPISLTGPKVFAGAETDPDTGETIETRLESRVLAQTETLIGVTLTVLEEKAYADGELIETALDYFAQHRDGSVYYFGERVDNFEDGQFRDHAGQWLSGEGANAPGIIMPASPVAGTTYQSEDAPGVAEDMYTVMSLNERVETPAGAWDGCLKTKDFTPLEPGITEFKYYCPGVGLVREEAPDGVLELVSAGPAPAAPSPTAPAPAAAPTKPAGVLAPNAGAGDDGEIDGTIVPVLAVTFAAGAAAGATGVLMLRRRSAR